MTAKEFFAEWDLKSLFNYGYAQCVAVYNQYCKDVVNCPVILVDSAKDIWNDYPIDYFDRILNTPDALPQLGDVMIWIMGNDGHVALCTDLNTNINTFVSFDQNWPVGSPCHYVEHNYDYVIGWLRPKVPSSSSVTIPKETFEMLVTKASLYDGFVAIGVKDVKDIQTIKQDLADKNGYIEGQNAQISTLNNSIAEIAKQLGIENDYPKIIGELQKLVSGENADQLLNQKIKDLSAELQLANLDVEHYKQEASISTKTLSEVRRALSEAEEAKILAQESLKRVSADLEMAKKDIILLKQQEGLITTISFLKYLIKIYKRGEVS